MYMLQINPSAHIILGKEGDIIITSNPVKATSFHNMGDAMRAAVKVNKKLGHHLARCLSF